ncbi:MAG TPA: hypothetical protein VFH49_12745 [Aquabacterium sp.]|nr:hypothetical protein [Aquabacterium sp.]
MLEAFDFASQGHTAGLIPPGSTTFDLLLAVRIAAALTCVATGAIAALSPKRPGRHPRLGTLYYRSLTVVVASAAWLAALRWPQDAYRLVLGTLSFAAAIFGRTARRRRWRWQRWRWIGLHLIGMSASYILLLTAFYVDNGQEPARVADPAAPCLLAAAQRSRAPPRRPCPGPLPRPRTRRPTHT